MKLLTIIGARPQFIKAAAVSRAIAKTPGLQEILVHTGQHFDANMSDVFFEEMDIPRPDHQLAIHSLSHGAMTGRMLEEIEKILMQERPDCVLVYGDTNSTLAGALAAKKLHLKVAHVEAGLRSFNLRMPEEVNRILTDRISDFLFCPTDAAVHNLDLEGFANFPCRIEQVGDVMQDAALFYLPKSEQQSAILDTLGLQKGEFFLATIHRAENTDDPLRLAQIVASLNRLAQESPVVFPVHPRTRARLAEQGLSASVRTLDPVGYLDMIQLIAGSRMVITDSGGLQKEAYFFQKYCLTLRPETEWIELVTHGFNRLSEPDPEQVMEAVHYFSRLSFPDASGLYGGGRASEAICNILSEAG
ncbi:MAG: UDP-N-acetylglucosamine 2-epimerase (non-hydrolyzing) [Saprospiraceae bacterium]|nr:UDP-N-acetylglucosamine 2-epimerase (non-hydrolyzing) [Saprospiraceae bacterium]